MGRRKLPIAQPKLYRDSRGLWQVTWTDTKTGKTIRRGCGTRNRKEAEAVMPRIVETAMSPAPPAAYTISELLDAYRDERTQREHSKTFDYAFEPLREFFGAMIPNQLTDASYRRYRAWRTKQKVRNAAALASKRSSKLVSDSTAVRELNALRGAVGWGKRNNWTGLDGITVHVPDSTPNVRLRFLSRAEAERLLAACVELHTALFVRIALATAARMSAILELKWDDVTWPMTRRGHEPKDEDNLIAVNVRDTPEVFWKDPKSGEEYFTGGRDFDLNLAAPLSFDLGRGRGNKRRGTGLIAQTNVGLYEALVRAYKRRKSEYVIEWRGRKVNRVSLGDAYRRANIEGATQHTLKHTAISWMVQAGISYNKIAKLTGTSARTIERVYGHHDPELLAAVGEVLSLD